MKVMIKMDKNKQFNIVNENNYLVTKHVETSAIPTNQLTSDLDQLNTAEEKTTYKANIAKGIKDPLVYRAMSALRLANPFKGY
ncbi:MAG: hypothetical protein UR73_C0014G0004 [candidate division WS6 bacterium GW2011_GWF1_35_23]|uniref:Uncharacterized protein n=1 Tax=candidate division WS6 bacterium GW2011_GWF1_35_23 TaxID=1619097 RepID=A0A0G0FDU4_9BACT|nr:MAG: hypothetical protein UR73_C0014G0004 [candidate division WS6 bacterium GW2011_GWF1_35_23]